MCCAIVRYVQKTKHNFFIYIFFRLVPRFVVGCLIRFLRSAYFLRYSLHVYALFTEINTALVHFD